MVTGQSSKMGATEANILLYVLPLTVLPPGQPIPTEIKGSRNEKVVGSDDDQNTEIGHKETDSSPAWKKRGAKFQVEGIYHWLQNKGFKIHKVG